MNLFELFVKIGVDDQASGKLEDLSSKLGNGLKTAAKIGTAAVGAAAAGITALTTAAVNNYAEYEQLVGGVETLFKASAEKVQEYAANAYKTAGMSANEYMSTVTSFSASLLQSLGGDTDKAAKYANQALTDMSDNANKMGTSMEMIQNAYQGFAKQNYTMLDNLKLGYGGTQSEMQRLISDAAKLSDTVDAQDMSFANIVKAINVVQTEMGITGTTAKEAASTIQGSVGMMKSSWTNLVTGISDENANLDVLITNFVDSVGTVAQNIVPKIGIALNSASKLIRDLIPVIVQEIPLLIEENLPILAEAAISIIQSLVDGISENQETLMETAFETITYLAESLITMLPEIVALGLDLIVSLANGIAESVPKLIPAIVGVVSQIVDTLTNPETLINIIDAAIDIVLALVQGLIGAIPELISAVPKIIASIVTVIIAELPTIVSAAIDIVFALINGLLGAIPELVAAIPNLIIGIVNGLLNNLDKIILAAPQIILSLIKGLIGAIPQLVMAIPKIIISIVKTFMSYDWSSIGENIVQGLKDGIEKMWSNLKSWFTNLFGDLIGIAKKILGIASPSKVFKQIGGFTAEGFGAGFEDKFAQVKDDMEDALNFGDASVGINASIRKVGVGAAGGAFTDTALASEIKGLRNDVKNLKIYLSTGALVGGVTDGIDQALGQKTVANSRRRLATSYG